MKIIFMGTPDFAVPCLEEILKRGYEVLMVVTQPDRPKGRGKKLASSPVKEIALVKNLPIIQPEKVRDPQTVEVLRKLQPDCIIVVAFGQILPKSILEIPPMGCINVHASLLPQYRGAAPINWAIIKGEETTGVTTMYMDEGLDTGDMILKKEISIGDMTAGELYDKMSILGADLLGETLGCIEKGTVKRNAQIDIESSYAPIMDKNLGKIEWENSAKDIYNLIRGVNPWPTAYTSYKGKSFKIWKSTIVNQECHGKAGQIINVSKDGLVVCTGNQLLNIEVIQFPNSKRMRVEEYLRGNTIEENSILGE